MIIKEYISKLEAANPWLRTPGSIKLTKAELLRMIRKSFAAGKDDAPELDSIFPIFSTK